MAADFLGVGLQLGEQRMAVGLHELLELLAFVRPRVAVPFFLRVEQRAHVVGVDRQSVRVAGEGRQRAAEEVDARIGARAGVVVLDDDGAAELGLHDRRAHVAVDELLVARTVAVRLQAFAELGESELRRRDRDGELEGVAAADAHILGDGAEPVGGVEVALQERRITAAPVAAGIEETRAGFAALVMDVGAFAVLQVAEEALALQVQDEEFLFAVAAVLEDRAMALVFFGGVDDIPALVDRQAAVHFDEGVLAELHRPDGHRLVPFPRGGDIHDVEVIARDQFLPGVLVAAVDRRRPAGLLPHDLGLRLRAFVEDIAERDDFHEGRGDARGDVGAAAVQADDTHADFFLRLRRQVPDRLVTSGTWTRRAHGGGGTMRQLRRIRLGLGRRRQA